MAKFLKQALLDQGPTIKASRFSLPFALAERPSRRTGRHAGLPYAASIRASVGIVLPRVLEIPGLRKILFGFQW
jgi:hypothetical protein